MRDALYSGLISLDDYNDLADEWTSLNETIRDYGNTRDWQFLMTDALDSGLLDFAGVVFDEMELTASYYENVLFDKYGITAYYDVGCSRFRNSENGQFVANPYELLIDSSVP